MLTIASPVRKKRGSNRFCGPNALSAITGFDTLHTAALLRKVSRKRSITGVAVAHMLLALRHLGIRAEMIAAYAQVPAKQRPTLQAWAADSVYKRRDDVILCVAGHHYSLVQGDRYVCGISKAVVPLSEAPYRRHRLASAYRLELVAESITDISDLGTPRRKTAAEKRAASLRSRTRMLARAFDVEIEVDDGRIIVWGPEFAEDGHDPFEGDHTAEGWVDAYQRVETYAALKRERPELFRP